MSQWLWEKSGGEWKKWGNDRVSHEKCVNLSMKWQDHIVSDPKVLLGKPIIKGTRISVELILELLAQGWTSEEILDNYSRLDHVHITAIFAYMAESMKDGLLGDMPQKSA